MRRPGPWLLVVVLSALGTVTGHEIAYWVTHEPRESLHDYLGHLPQIVLLLALLSLVGAAFVGRGARLALWPFPAVAIAGFMAQEHLERFAHAGSAPFLLDKPFFLVGLALQALVAIAAWLLARLLVRIVGTVRAPQTPGSTRTDSASPLLDRPVAVALFCGLGARAPPLDD